MKRILLVTLSALFLLASASSFATSDTKKTSMKSNWTCTTNASSGTTDADTKADKQMADSHKSAAASFAFAAKHCRDCTKITCESNATDSSNANATNTTAAPSTN